MKNRVYLFTALLLLLSANSHSQDWVVKLIQEGSDQGKISNKFPHNLESVMKSFIGTKVQNINFQQINNLLLSEDLNNYKGKTIIVQFGGTNCSGCKLQMPELSRIQETYGNRKVQIIFLFAQSKDIVKNYIKNKSLSGIIACVDSKTLLKPFQTIALPTAYIVDAQGIIKDGWVIPEKYESIEKRLQAILSLKNKLGRLTSHSS